MAEPLIISLFYRVAKEKEVLHNEHRIVRQELKEALSTEVLVVHFGHDGDTFLTVAAKLAVHLERADAIHLVAKEIYAIRQFVRERPDVNDTTTNCKLPRLIDIVSPVEAEAE